MQNESQTNQINPSESSYNEDITTPKNSNFKIPIQKKTDATKSSNNNKWSNLNKKIFQEDLEDMNPKLHKKIVLDTLNVYSEKDMSYLDEESEQSNTIERKQTNHKNVNDSIELDRIRNKSNKDEESATTKNNSVQDNEFLQEHSSQADVEFTDPEYEDELMQLDLNEQQDLIDNFKAMSNTDVELSIPFIVSKRNIVLDKFLEKSVYDKLKSGLILTRYFYIKKNFSFELKNITNFLKCNMRFETEEREYEVMTISKTRKRTVKHVLEDVILIERDEPIDTANQYQFTFQSASVFDESYAELCRELDLFVEPLKTMLTEFKNGEMEDDQLELESYLGTKIEKLIRKNKTKFTEFTEFASENSSKLIRYIRNVDCNLKDMMAFYGLLPRFFLLYKRIESSLEEEEDAVIMFYREKLLKIHKKWLANNNELFSYIGSFNVWIMLYQSLLEMPYSFEKDDLFKITMIEMMSKSLIEISLEKDRIRTSVKNLIKKYKDIYAELDEFFEGVEEHMHIVVPFDFPLLSKGQSKITIGLWTCLLCLLFGLFK